MRMMLMMMMQIMMMRINKNKKEKEKKKLLLLMMMMLLLVRHTDDDIEAIVFVYRKARRKDGPIRSLCYQYIVPPAVHDMYRHLCRLAASHDIPFKLPHYDSVALFVISLAVRLFKHGIIKITIKHLCRYLGKVGI